jgi:hypothetical protein
LAHAEILQVARNFSENISHIDHVKIWGENMSSYPCSCAMKQNFSRGTCICLIIFEEFLSPVWAQYFLWNKAKASTCSTKCDKSYHFLCRPWFIQWFLGIPQQWGTTVIEKNYWGMTHMTIPIQTHEIHFLMVLSRLLPTWTPKFSVCLTENNHKKGWSLPCKIPRFPASTAWGTRRFPPGCQGMNHWSMDHLIW